MGKKHKKTPPALKKAAENKRYVSAVHGDRSIIRRNLQSDV